MVVVVNSTFYSHGHHSGATHETVRLSESSAVQPSGADFSSLGTSLKGAKI